VVVEQLGVGADVVVHDDYFEPARGERLVLQGVQEPAEAKAARVRGHDNRYGWIRHGAGAYLGRESL
jgi:hypothetical protein